MKHAERSPGSARRERVDSNRKDRKENTIPLSGLFVRNDTHSRPFQAKNRIMGNAVSKFPIEGVFLTLPRRPSGYLGPGTPIRLSRGRHQGAGGRRRNVSAKRARPGEQQSRMRKTIGI